MSMVLTVMYVGDKRVSQTKFPMICKLTIMFLATEIPKIVSLSTELMDESVLA